MAATSIRQLVLAKVTSLLSAIESSGGDYTMDVGGRVYDYHLVPQNQPTYPLVWYAEGEEAVKADETERVNRSLPLEIGFVDSYMGDDPGARARECLADVQRALGVNESSPQTVTVTLTSGGTEAVPIEIQEEANALHPEGLISGFVYGSLALRVSYVTSRADPAKQ